MLSLCGSVYSAAEAAEATKAPEAPKASGAADGRAAQRHPSTQPWQRGKILEGVTE
jgi:hypothetical protein